MGFLIPRPPGDEPDGPHPHTLVDPRIQEESWGGRWSREAARWKAVALAEAVFGKGVESDLAATPGRDSFRGFLHLRVPFRDPDDHFHRERVFVWAASMDPVLREVPLLFVFGILEDVEPRADLPGWEAWTP